MTLFEAFLTDVVESNPGLTPRALAKLLIMEMKLAQFAVIDMGAEDYEEGDIPAAIDCGDTKPGSEPARVLH